MIENREMLFDIMREQPFRGDRELISSVHEVGDGYVFDTHSFLSSRSRGSLIHGADIMPTIFSCFNIALGNISVSQMEVPKIRFNKKSLNNITHYFTKEFNEIESRECNIFVHIKINNESYYLYGRENKSSKVQQSSNNFLNVLLSLKYLKTISSKAETFNTPYSGQKDNRVVPLEDIIGLDRSNLSIIKNKINDNIGYALSIVFDIFNATFGVHYKKSGLIISYEDLELSNDLANCLLDGSCELRIEESGSVKTLKSGRLGKKYKIALVRGIDKLLTCSISVAFNT